MCIPIRAIDYYKDIEHESNEAATAAAEKARYAREAATEKAGYVRQ